MCPREDETKRGVEWTNLGMGKLRSDRGKLSSFDDYITTVYFRHSIANFSDRFPSIIPVFCITRVKRICLFTLIQEMNRYSISNIPKFQFIAMNWFSQFTLNCSNKFGPRKWKTNKFIVNYSSYFMSYILIQIGHSFEALLFLFPLFVTVNVDGANQVNGLVINLRNDWWSHALAKQLNVEG